MRPSIQNKLSPTKLDLPSKEFFEAIAKEVPAAERRGAILLVGGADFGSAAVRRAQAPLRFDLKASYWSHAALICDWPDGDPKDAQGLEVSRRPASGAHHDPARNGVTPFSLERYLDGAAYPNLALAVITGPPPGGTEDSLLSNVDNAWRDRVVAAAQDPNHGRPQFELYAWLAEWIRFSMLPWTLPNPLLHGLPHPGAAFIDYAYTEAGLDLVPSATAPNTAPEHLWATFLHWHEHVGERWGTLKVWSRINQKESVS